MHASVSRSLRSVALAAAFLVAGCGTFKFGEEIDETKDWSVSKLYSEARAALMEGSYGEAIKLYEKLEARYPYGRYAQQAQLETAYAHFKEGEPELAIAAADRFIKLHPNHPNVDYAYYLKGLANFNDDLGYMYIISRQDLTERDPKAAREAFEAFKDLVQRFPNSKYAEDAKLRMAYLVNALASHEVHVARYYLKRGAYVAAVNRAQSALINYPQAPANEEGLAIMVKAYDAMGLTDLRNDAERVLKKNFPESPYLTGEVRKDKPWWVIW